jgi:anaerobic dimethyl sulfoxide reductase subunit A
MKRVGKRGEGKFERISWDQALDEIAARLKKTLDTWGNEAVYLNYGTGTLGATLSKSWPPAATPVARLMNCIGGYLNHYGDYSTAQIKRALPYMYGDKWVAGNSADNIAYSKLVILFGNNPGVTRMSGGGIMNDLVVAKKKGGARVIVIDPRYTDTAISLADEWIPIHPGTDAALVNGLAYVMIRENLVDHEFLRTHTVGFDEASLPESIPAGNSYTAYILGEGPDKTPKTPAWASALTGIPEARIVQLAREIAQAKPCYISQGWACQRHANGEQTARAICMLPVLTGNVGILGGNTGARESGPTLPFASFPTLTNPVKTSISVFMWTDAIERGLEMTDKKDGVQGREQLKAPIKFIWNYAGNAIVNQHSDSGKTHRILQDESKCETIVVIDNFLTPSARYADILLPGTVNLEEDDFTVQGYVSTMTYAVFARKAVEPFFESRDIFNICAGVAKRMGVEAAFTEGRTRGQWMQKVYDDSRALLPDLPAKLEDAFAMGFYKRRSDTPLVPHQDFRQDPKKFPLQTPSGKVEIFSKQMWDIAHSWTLPEGDRISALPEYLPTWEGVSDPLRDKYPLQLIGHHCKQRTHSTYGNVDWLKRIEPQELWISAVDAEARGIKQGDKVRVFNGRGATIVSAKVTLRMMPGVLSLPQGAWYTPDANGVDHGGCVNVLTSQRPTPFSKGNPQHTNLVQVVKA